MSDKIPNRFKRNNSKRTQDAMEDASEQKRSKGDNTRGARNPFSGVTILQYKSKSSAGNWHIFAKEWMKYAATKYGNLAQFMYSANNFQYYVPAQIAPPPLTTKSMPSTIPMVGLIKIMKTNASCETENLWN